MLNLIRTEGILLRRLPYGESSVIVHILTADHGLVHLIMNGVRSSKSHGKSGTLQLGHILEVVYYEKASKDLYRLKEVHIAHQQMYPSMDLYRLATVQYLVELTAQTLYQDGQLPVELYPELKNYLLQLDQVRPPRHLALRYLWRVIQRMGWIPDLDAPSGAYLHLTSGTWRDRPTADDLYLSTNEADVLRLVLSADVDAVTLDRAQSATLMDAGHAYMSLQLHYFRPPKTSDIYRDVLLAP